MNATTNPGPGNGNTLCERLRELLADEGEQALGRHPALAAHAAECAGCRRLLAAWSALPGLLDDLPDHEPDAELVAAVRTAVGAAPARRPARRGRFIAPYLASAALLLAAVGISRELLLREAPRLPAPVELRSADGLSGRDPGSAANAPPGGAPGEVGAERPRSEVPETEGIDAVGELEAFRADAPPPAGFGDEAADDDRQRSVASDRLKLARKEAARASTVSGPAVGDQAGADEARGNETLRDGERREEAPRDGAIRHEAPGDDKRDDSRSAASGSGGAAVAEAKQVAERDWSEAPPAPLAQTLREPGAAGAMQAPAKPDERVVPPAGPAPSVMTEAQRDTAGFDFFAHYRQTGGLAFQPATGYWANTHVPGDPAVRLLNARLAAWNSGGLPGGEALERAVRRVAQPFDAPADNALALNLMSDVAGIPADGQPTRLRLQVGVQGIEHRRGQRPAMQLGIVVDLPPDAPDAARIAARALLDALLEAKQAGDRFALVVTGSGTDQPGLVLGADDFRFGPLQLAKDRILGRSASPATTAGPGPDAAPGADASVSNTHAALQRAGALVQAAAGPGQPLGSSAILLLSARVLDDLDRLAALTHAHARDGVTTSVFPLGNGPTTEQAERLVLAGLGSRRILAAPADARRLVEDELHAASRAVARAARLSIRLAPGVRLVGVIGSARLDAPRAQQVRDIENAVDRRLAAELGIAADRGRDEEGIQLVIPAIHAGDSATVLVDLVTDRPGAIAEVTLRYKDLVYRRNGALSAQLQLPRRERAALDAPGPAERAVLKNLLAHHFTAVARQAADALGRGDAASAARLLRGLRATLKQARRDLPAWSDDPDLMRDEQVLERYIAALESPQAATGLSFLADSLRLAAWAKSHGWPEEWQ